jgi:Holliday junction DNA helicase RuvA
MYSFIEGIVESAGPLDVVINVNGIGFRIDIPVTTAEKLPAHGQRARLHVHPIYREDSQALYGFHSTSERDFFKLLLAKVSGIGPKTGLNLMSRLAFPLLLDAIARGDAAMLAKCPGIGKKTAERLCIELKDAVSGPGGSSASASSGKGATGSASVAAAPSAVGDAIQALVALGYKLDAADTAVRRAARAAGEDASADQLIRSALRERS